MRKNTRLHLIFEGPSNPPVHILIDSKIGGKDIPISKKDIAGLIKRMLYKCPKEKGKLIEVFPGCFIEKKTFESLVLELNKKIKNIFLLDKNGKDIRDIDLKGNEVFIIGDYQGFPNEKKRFLKRIEKISVSPKILFSSQCIVLLHNEFDRHNI
jgi:tRNA (pseudouridine54-N1)-methyltransferase